MLSARDKEADKVAALDLGADDYLTKPFGIGELLARLRVAERHLSARSGAPGDALVQIGDVTLDLAAHRVQRNGAELHLTPIEYQLLTTLARHRGKVLTHRQLLREVWGAAHVESPQYLRIYMRALRQQDRSRSRAAALAADRSRRGLSACGRGLTLPEFPPLRGVSPFPACGRGLG